MSVHDRRRQGDVPSLTHLSISSSSKSKPKPSSKHTAPDSWEDEADPPSPSSATASDPPTALFSPADLHTSKSTGSNAPPPTPITPYAQTPLSDPYSTGSSGLSADEPMTPLRGAFRPEDAPSYTTAAAVGGPYATRDGGEASEKNRPEKSTAAAARMIAAGLGVRAPKKTEEMRRYERAVRERERGRIEREREEKSRGEREREEAQRAIWED